jgi:cysteine sulfinate desulfinase/cysteine desulfurase-like protein
MGVDESIGVGAIRFSLGRTTKASEIDFVVQRLEEAIGKLDRAVGENLLAHRT